ncbi:MAG: GTP cyclohydrolase II [Candidatus Kerfeldbacteria bacterium]|nr:GTP cyclohydrolase II [Candidatus Kerfeldbacteria bacterium]
MNSFFSTIPEALDQIKKGRLLILVDSPKRENEGDFYIPADKISPQHIITMIQKGGGLVCAAITQAQAYRLSLPLMIDPLSNTEKTKVNFTISVNAKRGVTTGVSAFDRAKTIRILADPKSKQSDITKPGHVFGLVTKQGGVLERDGHTEAAVDLARIANLTPAGVLCEIIGIDGRMAGFKDLVSLSQKLNIKMVSINDLIKYLKRSPLPPLPEKSEVIKVATSTLPTIYGTFQISIYKSITDNREHAVLLKGNARQPLLTRVHSQCFTGDTLFSLRCDCKQQLHQSMKLINKAPSGVILYLDQEGRGIGLATKIKAYSLQDQGLDTVEANHKLGFPADARNYEVAAHILKDLGIKKINLLTNNPDKEKQLASFGISITKCIPIESQPNVANTKYLATKKHKLGHRLRRV